MNMAILVQVIQKIDFHRPRLKLKCTKIECFVLEEDIVQRLPRVSETRHEHFFRFDILYIQFERMALMLSFSCLTFECRAFAWSCSGFDRSLEILDLFATV